MTEKFKILLVEDEKIAREITASILEQEGYDVITAETGGAALFLAEDVNPDLILLDLGLPDIDGAIVAKRIKKNPSTKDVFIIILSARDDDLEIVSGLESFADDYITKPFKEKILSARIKAVMRSKQLERKEEVIKINDLIIDLSSFSVSVSKYDIRLTKTEFNILYFLATKPNWVMSRDQIINFVRGDGYSISNKAIDMGIARVRKKLGEAGRYIETVRGVGYKFINDAVY